MDGPGVQQPLELPRGSYLPSCFARKMLRGILLGTLFHPPELGGTMCMNMAASQHFRVAQTGQCSHGNRRGAAGGQASHCTVPLPPCMAADQCPPEP